MFEIYFTGASLHFFIRERGREETGVMMGRRLCGNKNF
jgi:hypothetical protein